MKKWGIEWVVTGSVGFVFFVYAIYRMVEGVLV